MPNTFAYMMLALWPLVTLVMFRSWPVKLALIWSLLGAYMLLPPSPTSFDFPLMPPLDKESLPSLVIFIACVVLWQGRARLLPDSLTAKVLVVLFVLGPVATGVSNLEPVTFGRVQVQGMALKDTVALVLLQFILLIPFLLARRVLSDADGPRTLIFALFIGGMIYSLPMLIEVRLSPQLNIWTYGYFQHMFSQMMRGDGFRPIVFMQHGLWVAFFTMTAMACALALARSSDTRQRMLYLVAFAYLGVVLLLCKSLGSVLLAAGLVPLVLFLSTRMQLQMASAIVLLALSYPLLKGAGLLPADWLLEQIARLSPERAFSLEFRFDNEDRLMERAMEKPVFGWGSWGRNHILNPWSGAIETITDGRWIILVGRLGWVGYVAEFGLIAFAVLSVWRAAARVDTDALPPLVGPLALLLAVNLVDMVPNATLTPITWLMAGVLVGQAERMRAGAAARRNSPAQDSPARGWQSVM